MRTLKHPSHTYQWFGQHHDENAQAVGEALEKLSQKTPITPDSIVEAAMDKHSVLHSIIYKDSQAEAAAKWRKQRARLLTNHLYIKVGKFETRAFVHTKTGGYVHVTKASKREIEERAVKELLSWVRRYGAEKGLNNLTTEVHEVAMRFVAGPVKTRKRA